MKRGNEHDRCQAAADPVNQYPAILAIQVNPTLELDNPPPSLQDPKTVTRTT